jgi:hypothetical protein
MSTNLETLKGMLGEKGYLVVLTPSWNKSVQITGSSKERGGSLEYFDGQMWRSAFGLASNPEEAAKDFLTRTQGRELRLGA